MPLRLHNTLSRRIEEFRPRDPANVTFYSCGPTVYDDAHIGNFRSFLAADVLRRWIESPLCEVAAPGGGVQRGPRRVTHVMNITDVGHMTDDAEGGESGEDRMAVAGRRIAEAKKAGKLPAGAEINPADPFAIAAFYADRFVEDASRLGLKVALEAAGDPTLMPRATANVPGMIALVKRLISQGNAYVAGEAGSRAVYFRVKSYGPYGRLSGNTLDSLREGEGGRVSAANQQQKEHPADFLLWKEDPRHLMSWPAEFGGGGGPWGKGYPGWHIECTVMSVARLRAAAGRPLTPEELAGLSVPDGEPLIDLHSGGEDNIFPHHECEMAQSCCAFNREPGVGSFASVWFHARFLLVNGMKMSKSKGNFFTARDLFTKGYTAGAVRLELIRTHYRSNADFREQGMKDAERQIERWRRFAEEGERSSDLGAQNAAVRDAFGAFMDEDLNVAGAIGVLNKWVAETPEPTRADGALMRTFDGVIGVLEREQAAALSHDIGVFIGVDSDPEVIALLEQRREARALKDFATSDRIRDTLTTMGYQIKDAAGGKVEVRRA